MRKNLVPLEAEIGYDPKAAAQLAENAGPGCELDLVGRKLFVTAGARSSETADGSDDEASLRFFELTSPVSSMGKLKWTRKQWLVVKETMDRAFDEMDAQPIQA